MVQLPGRRDEAQIDVVARGQLLPGIGGTGMDGRAFAACLLRGVSGALGPVLF
ncbi:hypothetical protein [Nocardiopsis oceani]